MPLVTELIAEIVGFSASMGAEAVKNPALENQGINQVETLLRSIGLSVEGIVSAAKEDPE